MFGPLLGPPLFGNSHVEHWTSWRLCKPVDRNVAQLASDLGKVRAVLNRERMDPVRGLVSTHRYSMSMIEYVYIHIHTHTGLFKSLISYTSR